MENFGKFLLLHFSILQYMCVYDKKNLHTINAEKSVEKRELSVLVRM